MIKVLVADDQALIRDSIKIVLEASGKFTVTDTAGNGKEVLDKLAVKQPDVILMDIRMPEMDGTVCTKYVKEKYPNIKVIILNAIYRLNSIFSSKFPTFWSI